MLRTNTHWSIAILLRFQW